MKVIRPITIVDSMVSASSAAEPGPGESAWAGATVYAAGQRVVRSTTHRTYERVVAGATPTAPESDTTNWLDVGPTNRWAMFDSQVSTATQHTGDLAVTLAPGGVSAVAVLDAVGAEVNVLMTDGAGGPTVYDHTISLDDAVITDWYEYLWEPFGQRAEAIFTDLPTYSDCRVIVTITGSAVQCGTLIVGTPYTFGDVETSPKIGITDYSQKDTDEFGVTTFVQRAFSKRLECVMVLQRSTFAAAFKVLSALRATPCVWVTSEDPDMSPLIVYGFYRDFSIVVTYKTHMVCALEIEGLI